VMGSPFKYQDSRSAVTVGAGVGMADSCERAGFTDSRTRVSATMTALARRLITPPLWTGARFVPGCSSTVGPRPTALDPSNVPLGPHQLEIGPRQGRIGRWGGLLSVAE